MAILSLVFARSFPADGYSVVTRSAFPDSEYLFSFHSYFVRLCNFKVTGYSQ